MTATEKRADAMEIMYQLHIGPVCYRNEEYDLKPECFFFEHHTNQKHLVKSGWDGFRKEQRVQWQLTARNLLFDKERQDAVFELVRQATDKGRSVLVLGDSVDGLGASFKRAQEVLPDLTHGLIVGSGRMKATQAARDSILQNNQVVWATARLLYRGIDKPAADTIIVASLVAVNEPFWTQAAGRILRSVPGKPPPKVIVIVDTTIGPIVGLGANLARIFKAQGWKRVGDKPLHEEMKRRREEEKYMRRGDGQDD